MNYNEFKRKYMGTAHDLDGAYGAQCWDGAMFYSQCLGYPVFHCGISGYAKDIWLQRRSSGILRYYTEVRQMQPGDICVFMPTAYWTPFSHIAIFDSDAGDGYGNFMGQNQDGVPEFTIQRLPYSATYPTAFRPKVFEQKSPSKKPVHWNYDAVLKRGDIISSAWLPIAVVPGTDSAIVRGMVNVPDLGGLVPLEDVDKQDGSDGYHDQVLHNTNAKVCLHETEVKAVASGHGRPDMALVNSGYWVLAQHLCRKE